MDTSYLETAARMLRLILNDPTTAHIYSTEVEGLLYNLAYGTEVTHLSDIGRALERCPDIHHRTLMRAVIFSLELLTATPTDFNTFKAFLETFGICYHEARTVV